MGWIRVPSLIERGKSWKPCLRHGGNLVGGLWVFFRVTNPRGLRFHDDHLLEKLECIEENLWKVFSEFYRGGGGVIVATMNERYGF